MSDPTLPPPPPSGGPSAYAQYPPPPPPPPPHQQPSPYSYGAPYPPQPWTAPGDDHTLRNVLLIVGGVVVVVGGLLVWLITSIVNTADRISDEFSTDYPGSESRPITVDEGEAFTIRGFDYAAGWSLGPGGDTPVSGLKATNDRPDRESDRADVRITLLRGNDIVDQFTCSADPTITYGRSAALDCGAASGPLPSYDTIEVNATALFS